MRHKKSSDRIGRSSAHRQATTAALVCSLIAEKRIKTTLAKARLTRKVAERMVTMARKGTLAARRNAISKLRRTESVSELFDTIVPQMEGRNGGYTRIVKIGQRGSDGSEMAFVEWVSANTAVPGETAKAAE